MFEGMSDDEDDFQSVSHSALNSRYLISCWMRSDHAGGYLCVYIYVCVCTRAAQQAPPAGQGARREYGQCL